MRTCLLCWARYFVFASALLPALSSASFAGSKLIIPPPPPPRITPSNPGQASLLGDLRSAKASSDVSALRAAEEQRGTVVVPPLRTPTTQIRVFPHDQITQGGEATRWSGDVCITCPWAVAGDPALAAGSDGTLYAAMMSADAHSIFQFQSRNGGESWQMILEAHDVELLGKPCVAVGEGNEDRLLCAFVLGSGTSSASVQVLTFNLRTGFADITTALWSPGSQLANPRICVDSPEWAYWFPYVVCLVQDLYATSVQFTRSLDYGDQWTVPVMIDVGMALADRADIDFGATTLTVAYSIRDVDSNVKLRISRDFGLSFEPSFPVTSTGYEETEPRIATTTSGNTTLVAFARQYGPGNRDIDCMWSTDSGYSWSGSYLPYSIQDERRPAVVASSATDRLYAAYWVEGEMWFTWADTPLPGDWHAPLTVNDEAASNLAWPAIALRPIPCICNPDMNCDGVINSDDIGPFLLAMNDPSAYQLQYPNCDISRADTDCDGDIDARDLERLMCLIAGLPDCCPDPGGDAGIAWLNDGVSAPGIWFDCASSRLPGQMAVTPVEPLAAGRLDVRPNPFTARATIGLVLPAAASCRVEICSVTGRRIAILHDGPCDAGSRAFTWDGRDDRGRACAPAVYFCRLEVNGYVEIRSLALVR